VIQSQALVTLRLIAEDGLCESLILLIVNYVFISFALSSNEFGVMVKFDIY